MRYVFANLIEWTIVGDFAGRLFAKNAFLRDLGVPDTTMNRICFTRESEKGKIVFFCKSFLNTRNRMKNS